MEILAGFIFGTATFIIYYREYLGKEKEFKNLVKIIKRMEAKIDEVARTEISTIKEDIRWIRKEVIALKVSMGTIKAKVGYMAGGFSFAGALVFAIVKEFAFK